MQIAQKIEAIFSFSQSAREGLVKSDSNFSVPTILKLATAIHGVYVKLMGQFLSTSRWISKYPFSKIEQKRPESL